MGEIIGGTIEDVGVDAVANSAVTLRRDMPILLRPGGRIQFGTTPDSAVVVPLPEESSPGPIWSAILGATRGECLRESLNNTSLPPALVNQLITELTSARLTQPPATFLQLTIIGRDQVKHALHDAVRHRTPSPHLKGIGRHTLSWLTDTSPDDVGLVVLTGMEVPHQQMIEILWRRRLPHLCVHLRDGRAVLGPLTVPGYSPCPMCAESHRRSDDSARELLALQLRNQTASGSPLVISSLVNMIVLQLERIAHYGYADSPLLATEVTVDLVGLHHVAKPVLPHPNCPVCRRRK